MTRWQKWYLEDERLPSIPPSLCAQAAVDLFSEHGKRVLLDVGCGVGRDALYLSQHGFTVVGVDAAEAAVRIAHRLKVERHLEALLIQADGRTLPFADASLDGIYCFGLLHEFTDETRDQDVRAVMDEIHRVLAWGGILILTVLSGDPEAGMPAVRLFTEQMFDEATQSFQLVDKREVADIGCTGREDYWVWRGVLIKQPAVHLGNTTQTVASCDRGVDRGRGPVQQSRRHLEYDITPLTHHPHRAIMGR
ncbi:MAG: class I SAM-dependent methyltransferase [Anaerolineae bacterium]